MSETDTQDGLEAAIARARLLQLPPSGPAIVLIEQDRDRARDWVRQSREMSGRYIGYRTHERILSAEGIGIIVYVVVAYRREGIR